MKKDEILETGKEVLNIEAKAVESLASSLDENFTRAVELIYSSNSRVIVTGMGKSGLVGRKIAATLASCGTPSIFIHPAEAGHGDLGMILKDDILIAISYSGETRELVALLEFVKRSGVKLISITGDKHSKLAQYSNIVIEAKVEREAEPSFLIPTSSSTTALALGDAIAIALMKKKGFGEKDFAFFHPKGQASKKLLKVAHLMHRGRQIPRVKKDTLMRNVLEEMSRKKFGMTCVTQEDGTLMGIITDGDLRRMVQKYRKNFLEKTAGDCMTANPKTISRDDLATEALNIMEESKITSLVVKSKKGKIDGIIHLHDLWRTEMF